MKNVTLKELIEAAEKNGFPWIGHGTRNEKSENTRYCVLEQAALNLGLHRSSWAEISEGLNAISPKLGETIWVYNDDQAKSYEEAFSFLKKSLEPFSEDTKITVLP